MRGKTFGLRTALLAVCLIAVQGCAAQYRTHGYVPSDEELSSIVVGVDTKTTVEEVVGAPSTSGVLQDGAYYYVQSQVRHFAWQAPQVTERQVLAISFDSAGVVQNIERFGLEDGQVVPLSRRVTRSGGDISFIRKLLGNIGRLSASELFN